MGWMASLSRLGCLVLSLLLAACAREIPLTPDGTPMAEIRGPHAPCRDNIRIVLTDRSEVHRHYLSPGPIEIEVEADSEPGYQDGFIGDASYMCSRRSRHRLSFEAAPGRSYRLRLVERGPRRYGVEVWEASSPEKVESRLVRSESNQISIDARCGFIGLEPGCDSFYGE